MTAPLLPGMQSLTEQTREAIWAAAQANVARAPRPDKALRDRLALLLNPPVVVAMDESRGAA